MGGCRHPGALGEQKTLFFLSCLFQSSKQILAVLACKDRWQPALLVFLACFLQGLACTESALSTDCMPSTSEACHFAPLSPQLVRTVALPAAFRKPFYIPAARNSQAFNLLSCSIAQNTPAASGTNHIVGLKHELVICHGRVCAIHKALDQFLFGLCDLRLASLQIKLHH